MDVQQQLLNKYRDVKFLVECVQHFSNWPQIWLAYQRKQLLPELIPRTKNRPIRIQHTLGDQPIGLFKEIFIGHCYTPSWFYQPSSQDTVIDLGANIGIFMLYLAEQCPDIQIHCFEPSTQTRRCLEAQVAVNSLQNQIRVYPYAVSNKAGMASLKLAKNSGHQSLFHSRFVGTDTEGVETLSLQAALDQCAVTDVNLLKIDVEGAEVEIVEGAPSHVWDRIQRVVCEYHDLLRPGCRERVVTCLVRNGFTVQVSPPAGNLGLIYAHREPAPK